MNPIISIIIPCYNHGKYIQIALDSIEKAKDNYPIEIIIVNDGSNDQETIEILKRIEKDGYFVLNQKNGGLGNARNNGIKLAKGKYILPLDCDNRILEPYLNKAIDILENNNNIGVVHGDAEYFGNKKGVWKIEPFDLKKMLAVNYIDACAVFRKKLWEDVGGYEENMPAQGHEDWEFWIALGTSNVQFHHLNKKVFCYFVSKDSMIRTFTDKMLQSNYDFIFKKYSNFYQHYYKEMYSLYLKNHMQYNENLKSEKFVINLFCKKFLGFRIFKL